MDRRTTIITRRLPAWDEHVVHRAQKGERVAQEILVDMYRPAVLSQAMRMLRDVEDANDATQETFLKAFRALASFDSSRPLLPWLLRICSNCCVDMLRGRRVCLENIENHEHNLSDARADVEDGVESSMGVDSVRDAIQRLPERYRQILMMRHYRHMDVCEIAKALGKPEGTIKSWLFRARALLRKDLRLAHI